MTAAQHDPRERMDRLGWVTRAVFADDRIWLATGDPDRSPPSGISVVARYLVAPSLQRARFLLPVAARRVTAGSVLAYNALRAPRVRAARTVLGLLARLGVIGLARLPVLQVGVPAGRSLLLTDQLAAQLGRQRLHAAIGVPTPDPNYKPTLQLFDDLGRPCGYAKIGWNEATRGLVNTELAALRALPTTAGGDYPYVPRVLAGGDWGGQAVALIEPLPLAVRRLPPSASPRLTELLAVARRGGAVAPSRPFGDSAYLTRLSRLAAGAAGQTGEAGGRVAWAVRRLRDRYRSVRLEFGAWHGDWVPWNLGRLPDGRLAVWDWEHSGSTAPVGLDLAHQGFQSALTLHGADAATATDAAAGLVARYGDRVGLGVQQQRLLVDVYLVELWLRTWQLASAGAGWNEALHPALLAVLEQRLTAAEAAAPAD